MSKRMPISNEAIRELYVEQKLSVKQIADLIGCSEGGIYERLKKMEIPRRSVSEAIYVRHNPDGDPFKWQMPLTAEDWQLFGMGLGLYWGEGNKRNRQAIRICNTDPRLLKAFMDFMSRFFCMGPEKAKAHVQMFNDMDIEETATFWREQLGMTEEQFAKPLMTISDSMGTHNNKSKYGVCSLRYQNTKLTALVQRELAYFAREYGIAQELTIPREMVKYRPIARKD